MELFRGLRTELLNQPVFVLLYDADTNYVNFWDHEMDCNRKLIFTTISALMVVVGLVGNILVPLVFGFKKKYTKSTNIFFAFINAVNSIFLVISGAPFVLHLNKIQIWFVDTVSCRLLPVLRLTLINISLLITVIIAIEQYYEIREPFELSPAFSPKKAIYICIAGSLVAFICASPSSMFYYYVHQRDGYWTELACMIDPRDEHVKHFYTYNTYFNFVFVVLTPVACANYYYLRIILLLSYRKYETSCSKINLCEQLSEPRPISFVILGTTALTLNVFLIPTKIFHFWEDVNRQSHSLQSLFFYECVSEVASLAYCSFGSVIFFIISSEFRQDTMSLFHCKRNKRNCIKLEMTDL